MLMNDPERNSVIEIREAMIEILNKENATKGRGSDNAIASISKPKRGGKSSNDLLKEQCP